MTSRPHYPQPAPATALGGRVLAAGEATRLLIARHLGLEGGQAPFSVQAVAWVDHALEVAVTTGGAEPAVLRIEAVTPDSQGLVVTTHLNVYFRGQDVPPMLVAHVARQARRQLADFTLDRIAQLVAADPELGHAGLAMPPAADESGRPRSLLDTWGSGDGYADFFATGEIARSQLDSIFSSRLFRYVQHCDAECLQVNPHAVVPTVLLVNYPWDDRLRRPFGAPPDEPGAEGDPEGMLTTDLTEDDVIFGNPDKLERVLRHALSRPHAEGTEIFFSNTCVPAVIGDDVQSLVQRVEEEAGRRVFYLTVTPRSMTTVFKNLLVERRGDAERRAAPPDADAVNLIGFPACRAVRELADLLLRVGVRVNVRLIPEIRLDLVEQLPRAALNVVSGNRTWQHLVDQLTFESRIAHVALPAPYGFELTRAWLRGVVDALGRTSDMDAAWEKHAAPWRERWEELRREAGTYRLGLVVRDEEIYLLTTPGVTWGVPLIAVLEEMGFGLDVLVKVSDRKTANEKARELRASFSRPERHSIRAFDSFAFLRHRLRESPSRAFLSYQFFDWRLTEAGKSSFSLQAFEMGIPGAVRTLERLLAACRTEFYPRYRRYLARTTEGLRATPAPVADAGAQR